MQKNSGDVLLLAGAVKTDFSDSETAAKQREILASTIIHDLKNPLQAQISGLELLSKGTLGSLNSSQAEIVNLTISSAKYMQGMISDILLAFKSEYGKLTVCKEKFNIEKLVTEIINENIFCAHEKGLEIICTNKLPKNNVEILADKRILRRVIENLISNAITYANKNTEIKIELTKKAENFEFNIGNYSPEIPEDIAKCVFDKYSSGNSVEKIGIGLGLYFCKLALDAHNGKISLKSYKDYNVFSFNIPY